MNNSSHYLNYTTIRRLAAFGTLLGMMGICHGADIYVWGKGNDKWSGTKVTPTADGTDGPVATLAGAVTRVHEQLYSGTNPAKVNVFLRGGTYRMTHRFTFHPGDADKPGAQVEFSSYQSERPIISGAIEVGGFKPWRGHILAAHLEWPKGRPPLSAIYYKYTRQTLARTPNLDPADRIGGGWSYLAGTPISMYATSPQDSLTNCFYTPGLLPDNADLTGAQMFVYPRYNWNNNILPVASFNPGKHEIVLASKATYELRPGDRFYLQNFRDALDAPGEWYYDQKGSTLFFWPPDESTDPVVEVPACQDLVATTAGVHDLTFRGITFDDFVGTAVVFDHVTNCTVTSCIVRHESGYYTPGINIQGGARNSVTRSRIYDLDGDGVSLSGGDVETLAGCGNRVEDDEIFQIGLAKKDGAAVKCNGVGLQVSHCYLHDLPRWAILFSGAKCIFDLNDIHDVCQETEDVGAIYTDGRDWINSRGCDIVYNLIRDSLGFGQENGRFKKGHLGYGVYLDDNTAGVTVFGNVIQGTSRGGVFIHAGRDNLIKNNIMLDCGDCEVRFDGWLANDASWQQYLPQAVKNYERYAMMPAWRAAGLMNKHPMQSTAASGSTMIGNHVEGNIFAYNRPSAQLYEFRNMPYQANFFDKNLIYHYGHPIRMGYVQGGNYTSPNRLPPVQLGGGGWTISGKKGNAEVQLANGAGGRSLELIGGNESLGTTAPSPLVGVNSEEIAAQPGGIYDLSFRLHANAPGVLVQVVAGLNVDHKNHGNVATTFLASTAEETHHFQFRIPAAGESGAGAGANGIRLGISTFSPKATVAFTPTELRQMEAKEEWAGWREAGFDTHSVIEDPKFVDLAKGNYRFAEGSPALKMGFPTIPFDQIGISPVARKSGWPMGGEN